MIQARTELLPHQRPAVDKLLRARVGALFMEMGTGKTRTAIEFGLLRQHKIDRLLWFCPVTLKETIRYELLKHTTTPPDRVHLFDEHTTASTAPLDAFWHVIGLESVGGSDRVALAANALITDKTFVIVDESSYIKGHDSRRTQRLTAFCERARYRMILTGTPLSQGVEDLFAQMRFLSPDILGYRSFYTFARKHLEYSDKFPGMVVGAHNTQLLAGKIQPYVYQVTKAECLDLPEKLAESRYYCLTTRQSAMYDQAKEELLLGLDPDDISPYAIFQLFTVLQQIVSGFWNRRDPATGEKQLLTFPHRRIDILNSILAGIPSAAQVIIWCKYLHSVQRIAESLAETYGAENVARYDGTLSAQERHAEESRFHAGARFFVATQASGGHGLTLNEAHYSIFYENEFKYSHRQQAEDRNHRIGQTRRVTYVDIVASGTIDMRIMRALASKGNVVDDFRRMVDAVKHVRGGVADIAKEL